MKRILALIIAIMLAIGSTCAFAEPPSGSPGGGQPPQGGPGGDMGNPPDGMGGPGGNGGPGGDAAKAEGVIGSWSSGGSEDYEYDAALNITGEGIDEEKSSTDRIVSGEYDASSADGIVIEETQSGDNGILVLKKVEG